MTHRKLLAGVVSLALAMAATAAVASGASAPSRTTINAVPGSTQVKINRYIQDGLRWQHDTYQVRSGGTLRVVNLAPGEGPHTFTVVKATDLPRTVRQVENCRICETLGRAHGADPQSQGPPKFLYLENGVGQKTAPNVDRPGDSGITGERRGNSISFKVTAKRGSTLHFMCLIHPWMQAKVLVR